MDPPTLQKPIFTWYAPPTYATTMKKTIFLYDFKMILNPLIDTNLGALPLGDIVFDLFSCNAESYIFQGVSEFLSKLKCA